MTKTQLNNHCATKQKERNSNAVSVCTQLLRLTLENTYIFMNSNTINHFPNSTFGLHAFYTRNNPLIEKKNLKTFSLFSDNFVLSHQECYPTNFFNAQIIRLNFEIVGRHFFFELKYLIKIYTHGIRNYAQYICNTLSIFSLH